MSRALIAMWSVGFVGLTLLLSTVSWFARRPLAERVRPYTAAGRDQAPAFAFSIRSFRDVVAPLAQTLGTRLAEAFGVHEDLGERLHRVHATEEATQFRLRQLAWAFGTFIAATAVVSISGLPAIVVLLVVLAAPVLAFLVVEQRLISESQRWQRRLFLELPVVSEQIGMLIGAGYSLAAALNRVAQRGTGACAADLTRVCGRMRQGLSDIDALREWSTNANVEAVHRLVGVLAMNRQAADLSRLIAEEARAARRDAQRDLIETIERRAQMVWIPVTVAALIPGVIFMAVPFVDALTLFSGS